MRIWAWMLLPLLACFPGREPEANGVLHALLLRKAPRQGGDSLPAPRGQSSWSLNLHAMFRHRTFEQIDGRPWTSQQGVRFITPEIVAVYQVNETVRHAPLAPKDRSGGSGNFYLQAEIVDSRDRRAPRRLRWPTNAGLAKILPTHDGQFLVRTGDIFYLYSQALQPVASRNLPLDRVTPFEQWDLDVSPSGAEIVLAHRQIFRNEQGSETDSKVEIEVLNADTLAVLAAFRVQHLIDWSVAEHAIVVSDPKDDSRPKFGVLGWDGKWKRIKTALEPSEPGCPYSMRALDHERVAAFGCRGLLVLSGAGEEVLSRKIPPREFFASVSAAGDCLAVKSLSYQSDFLGFRTGPLSIDVYDLRRGDGLSSVPVFSVPLEKHNVYFDVSKQGDLAMVEGEELKFYSAAGH